MEGSGRGTWEEIISLGGKRMLIASGLIYQGYDNLNLVRICDLFHRVEVCRAEGYLISAPTDWDDSRLQSWMKSRGALHPGQLSSADLALVVRRLEEELSSLEVSVCLRN